MAQVETGRIAGTVTDSSGSRIPGAVVTVTHVATNVSTAWQTDATGRYLAVNLRVGEYRVDVEASGFKRIVRSGIVLQIAETADVDLTLEVGSVAESINVTADAPLLETTNAAQGQVIDNRKIVDIPLNGRDYKQLALLSAGALQPIGGRFGGFSASGQRVSQNNYLLDGLDNNNMQIAAQGRRAEAMQPSVDAIQEFKVFTNAFSAEYGRALGGVVNVTIKSGTNDLHGTVFGFLRNDKLDAKNFFDLPNQPKPPFKRSQFGFAAGGPIVKNRTFWFANYEGTRIRESRTVNNTIPTIAQRTGDFRDTGVTIYDPSTYDATTRTRQPFPDNVIPANRIDPIAVQVAATYPAPQNDRLTQNFLYNPANPEDNNRFDVRVDHTIGSADSIYYRMSWQHEDEPSSPSLPPPALAGGDNLTPFQHDGRNTVLVWNHIFSPAVVSSSRVGWNGIFTDRLSPIDYNLPSQLGLRGVDQSLAGSPAFNIGDVTSLGVGANVPNIAHSQTRQLINDTTWTKGAHTLKFGINFYWLQSFLTNPQQSIGVFSFNGNYTRNPLNNQGGRPFADFLLGIANQANASNYTYMRLRAMHAHFYANDEWRVRSNLTLNFGVRVERNRPWYEKNNGIANFDIDTDPSTPAWRLARDGSALDRSTYDTGRGQLAPRFGFAWQRDRQTVVRGGYGIFIAAMEGTGGAEFIQNNPPFHTKVQLTTDSVTPTIVLREGLPANLLVPERATNLVFSSFQRNANWPVGQQWNLNIQRQLASNWVLETGYYGAKANHLVYRWNANYALPGPGNINARRRYRTIAYPGTETVIGPLAQMNRHEFDGNSLFHSLQTRLEKRFAGGFTMLASYMWSKTIGDVSGFSASGSAPGAGGGPPNPLDRRAERGLDNQHLAHRFVTSYVYELPFGPGKAWGSAWRGVGNAVLGGWSLGGIVTLTSGQPVNLTVQGDPANTGDPNRPDVAGDWRLDRSERTLDRFFNTGAFVRNAPFTYGNAGRNILEQPGSANVDFAAFKRFSIAERIAAQFRFEAFNFFNTPQFGAPNAQVGNINFGRIADAGRPRNLQFGLKLLF